MISRLLTKSSLRHLITHPLQIFLTILGVAMGVAVVIAIDLASSSAEMAFTASTKTLSSKVTHKIENSSQGLDENVYAQLRLKHAQIKMAPIVEKMVNAENYPNQYFRIFGIDPFSESNFRSFDGKTKANNSLTNLLNQPNAAMISESMANTYKIKINDKIALKINGRQKILHIVDFIKTKNKNVETALDNVFICDISVAQNILNSHGILSRIELNIQNISALEQIKLDTPKNYQLISINSSNQSLSQMTAAFRTNLAAMSLLALIVGMFLIYNTITFSLIQRREQFATLRSIGVTHKEIFFMVFSETFIIGLIGTVIGLILGLFLGKGLLILVVRTINDLYFDLNLSQLNISPLSLLKGLFIGLVATLVSAWLPMREAFKSSPQENLNRSNFEASKKNLTSKLAFYGVIILIFSLAMLSITDDSLVMSFAFMFFVFCGYALLVPYATVKSIYLIRPIIAKYFGYIGNMSIGNISNSLSRTGVAMTALTLAVATTVGVGTMVSSFRHAVSDWLDQSLIEDVYISQKNKTNNPAKIQSIDQLHKHIKSNADVKHISIRLWTKISSDLGKHPTLVQEIPEQGFKKFKFLSDRNLASYQAFNNKNNLLISEPLANKHKLNTGDFISLFTDNGKVKFKIIGIYRDYTSDQGVISISRKAYLQHWRNNSISSLGLYLQPDISSEQFISQLEKEIKANKPLLNSNIEIRSNTVIREHSLEIFDQTFAITNVLRVLTIIVAFIGILSAFMALQLERGREFATLRVIGLTPQQLWIALICETSFMGFLAGLFAIPLGLLLSAVLIFVINIQSFGWSMDLTPDITALLFAVLFSISAAFLAGIYPAYKMSRVEPAVSLRND